MRFKYDPEDPLVFPESVCLVAVEAEEQEEESDVGEVRWYEAASKRKLACRTIREQRSRIDDLEDALDGLFDCLDKHREAHLPPSEHAVDFWRSKLRRIGITLRRE